MKTPVIFRKDKDEIVFALFPTLPSDPAGLYVTSYESIGGHSSADLYGCMIATIPATPDDYASIKLDLERIGYDLHVRARTSRKDREILLAELNRTIGA